MCEPTLTCYGKSGLRITLSGLSSKLANRWVLLANNHKQCWNAWICPHPKPLEGQPCGRSKGIFTHTTYFITTYSLVAKYLTLISHTQPSVRQDISQSSTKPLSTIVKPGQLLSTISVQPQPLLRLLRPSCMFSSLSDRASFGTSTSPLNLLMCVYEICFIF